MPIYMTKEEAVLTVKDGDCVVNSAFLTHLNPMELMGALGRRRKETGAPNNLTLFCSAGFGSWGEGSDCELPVIEGAVSKVIASHFSSTPGTARMILENKIEGYNLPFGALAHLVRARAAGRKTYHTPTGVNLYVDPKYDQYRLNEKSKDVLVEKLHEDGVEQLSYSAPNFDVAFIKGTFSDMEGNISFDDEGIAGDTLSLAMAVRRNGGKVIVQVGKKIEGRNRPWYTILPAFLVDIIVICPEQTQVAGTEGYNPAYSGEAALSREEMREYIIDREKDSKPNPARTLVAKRAVKELSHGDIVNIGVGMPEGVAVEAAKNGMLDDMVLTVESGPINGVPASGKHFGVSIGPHSIITVCQMFDFYDGGGLDITFLGALEVDKKGNVNSHLSGKKLSGIGGFANISQFSKTVIFCFNFTSGGLEVKEGEKGIEIIQEGRQQKFVENVSTISFSTENARRNGQRVLYVTERCVFRLGEKGLCLCEVSPGVDAERDILSKLPFEIEVDLG